MSTRSKIGIANTDGSITGIYCHYDGYLSHHAPILLNHYNTAAKVRALMKLGSLSALGEQLGEKHDIGDHKGHPLWCKSYKRDGEDDDGNAGHYTSLAEFASQEYNYLYRAEQWWLVEKNYGLTDLRVAFITDRLTA